MSRSYKKFPACTDAGRHGSRKDMRTLANRCVRRKMDALAARSMYEEEDDFIMTSPREKSAYKKHFESYDIHDYKFIFPRKSACKKWESEKKKAAHGGMYYFYSEEDKTIKDFLKWWEKYYHRK